MAVESWLLSIEDNPVDAYLIQATFAALGRRRPAAAFGVLQASTLAEGLTLLREREVHVILLDLGLPDARGTSAVARLREVRPDVPILVLTSVDDEQLAQRALQAGAQDYLVKGRLDMGLLDRVARHAIERQRLASALTRAHTRELERRDELLSHVSHELRTPLAAIEQFGSILRDGLTGPLSDEQSECVDVLCRNARQLRRMVDDLLEVARADTGRLAVRRTPVDLGPLIRNTLASLSGLAHGKGVLLRSRIGAARLAHADPARVEQVLSNLVENAIKFTPAEGTVEVCLSDGREGEDQLRLTVSDSGCGIPADELPRIFDRLGQGSSSPLETSRKGLGLGLWISRQLVELHGGCLWAESESGRGSRFHALLPAYDLPRLLRPLVERASGHDEPFHLVRVALSRDASGVRPPRSLAALESVSAHCCEEVSGVLLPAEASGGGERLLVLRCAGPSARALVQRLRRRLARVSGMRGSAAPFVVSRQVLLEPNRGGHAAVLAVLIARLAQPQTLPSDTTPQRLQAKGTSSTNTQ